MDITIKNLGESTYRIIADGRDIGTVGKETDRLGATTWRAYPAVDGEPSGARASEPTRSRAIRWLTEGPRYELRAPGCCRFGEYLDRRDAEADMARHPMHGAVVQALGEHEV